MAVPPSPRTSPTIKPLVTSNRVRRDWEVRLSMLQSLIFGGVVLGCLVSSFYLGLVSGQKAGFESAQAVRVASSVKLPISGSISDTDEDGVIASDIYAKLRNPPALKVDPDKAIEPEPLPKLESIKSIETAPLIEAEDSSASEAKLVAEDTSDIESLLKKPSEDALRGVEKTKVSEKSTKSSNSLKAGESIKPRESSSLGSLVKPEAKVEQKIETKPDTKVEAKAEKKPEQGKVSKTGATETPKVLAAANTETLATDTLKPKVEAVKKPTTQSTGPQIREVLPKGWFAQVAAPRQRSDAEDVARKLQKGGFPVLIQEANVRGQVYYRVMVGPADSRQGSEQLIKRLKGESYLRGEPFLRLIK